MTGAVFNSANEVQLWALETVLNSGSESSPRGMHTREVLSTSFRLSDPRNRCITIPERGWNLALAIGEFCWHAAASDRVEFIAHYSSRWREFSDDGSRILGSCYGHKMFSAYSNRESQWEQAKRILLDDHDSRRAIITFNEPSEQRLDSRDVACATSIQFLVRGNHLHAVVNMRSNDAVWGLPYDLFIFTMFQEMMANCLGLPIGNYFHSMASLHVYDRHFKMAERVAASAETQSSPMPPMERVDQLEDFLAGEREIRNGRDPLPSLVLAQYWSTMLQALKAHRASRRAA